MKYLLLSTTLLFLLGNCTSRLNEKEIKWNPYTDGETLVFESTNYEMDSFYIYSIMNRFSNNSEILDVSCKYFEKHIGDPEKTDTVKSFFIALTAYPNNNSVLTINLNRHFAVFPQFTAKRLSWMDSLKQTSVQTNFGVLDDVIVLYPDTDNPKFKNYMNDSACIEKLFWSKSKGIIRFDMANSHKKWLLKKKYVQ